MDRTSQKRNGDTSKRRGQTCRLFQAGKCHYGSTCKFLHAGKETNTSPGPQTRLHTSTPRSNNQPALDGLREWKRLLNRGPDNRACGQFFRLAHQLMDGDVGGAQEVIKLFAEDDGLAFVRYLIERQISQANSDESRRDLWRTEIHPLFEFITHPRVLHSAAFETEVAIIYNFVQGIGGSRMKILYNFVINLPDIKAASSAPKGDSSSIIEILLQVLVKMIDCNTSNIINVDFKLVFDGLNSLLNHGQGSSDDLSNSRAQIYLQHIGRRLEVGNSLPGQVKKQTPISSAEFIIKRDLPGNLSPDGPRHDNDKENIAGIRIMPTYEEIVSPRSEYLPTSDSSLFHVPGVRGRLDREFRLLREDTVGQLRDAVHAQLDIMKQRGRSLRNRNNGLRTHVYENATFENITFDRLQGMDLLVGIHQAAPAKELKKRHEWWTHSKRFQTGALVCVVSECGSVLFCVVADKTVITSGQNANGQHNESPESQTTIEQERKPSLADDPAYSYVHLNIAEVDKDNIIQVLRWYRDIGPPKRRCVVEFPGVLLPSFKYTLEALQGMSKTLDLPFSDFIAPSQQGQDAQVGPPLYATTRGFKFDLSCLTESNVSLKHSPHEPMQPQELAKHSALDATQSTALLDSLSRSLALIQGPPGTGKSYTGEKIIKVLLANKKAAKLGPILCVCYTNHALDQLLEHLLDADVKQIVRIGSRSKSARLEKVNLRLVVGKSDRTKAERHALWEWEEALRGHSAHTMQLLNELEHCHSQGALQEYLKHNHPQHWDEFFGEDEEGFKTVRHRPDQMLDDWRRSGSRSTSPPRTVDDLLEAKLGDMTHEERARLYNHWLRDVRDPIIKEISREYLQYMKNKQKRDMVTREVDLRCLSGADVIGVTTTGLARNMQLLQKLRCKVMLCEEAGEVLEAHTLTALLPSVEHAILIGDHLQLRPQTQNYELQSSNPRGAQYSLDMSLFERLVNPLHAHEPRLPFRTLETQRRMHPSVANLVRHTLYPSLEDGGSVFGYPEVSGIKKRLFWLDHEVPEDHSTQLDANSTSRTNSFEVQMTIALVQHLIRQGRYASEDIAVITPYLGQLFLLRRRMSSLFEISVGDRDQESLEALEADILAEPLDGALPAKPISRKATILQSIRLATVDNFQGEEAKVVVISLVRSNDEKKCGFLRTSNRINVLLSRAKHGMYLIGNSKTYGHVDMWAQVVRLLEKDGNIGTQLELQCPRHPDTPILISQPDHFLQFSPEGGCVLTCSRRLYCGHPCTKRCHSDVLHNAVKCYEPCPRPKKGCDHPCRLKCGDPCEPKCTERVQGISLALACGHIVSSAPCWHVQDPSVIICREKVLKTVPGCNHMVTEYCHVDVTSDTYECQQRCDEPQVCGHRCRSPCYRCKQRTGGKVSSENHGICEQQCGRKYTTCPHSCIRPCHGGVPCPPCPAPCEVRCGHSKCSKMCHEPCAPCAEQSCESKCPHTQCTMPCAAPCDWVPCSKRCEQFLSCGHQCPSVCGEICPNEKYCQKCCSEDIRSAVVDYIMGMEYHEIDLDEDPCIFPQCGHFTTKSNMDGIMDIKAHYDMSPEGNPVSVARACPPFSMDEVKSCPTCRGSLRSIGRYGRIVRRAMLDEATKKFMAWSNAEYLKLADRLINTQQALSEEPRPQVLQHKARPSKTVISRGRAKQLNLVHNWTGSERYRKAVSLWNAISSFIGQVRKEEQPFQRVADFVTYAVRQRRVQGQFAFDDSLIQVKGYLQASALLLRCDTVIFSDFMEVYQALKGARDEIKVDFTEHFKGCESLIQLARSTKHPREEVEGHVYFANFCAFARKLRAEDPAAAAEAPAVMTAVKADSTTDDGLRAQGVEHLATARQLLDTFPSTKYLEPEIEAAETMLRDGVFYQKISTGEMRAVYEVMAREFSGTGHWYTCQNGHPFTVGECGMPMEQASCPECGAPVGGRSHMPAEGVQRANDIENLARGVGQLGIE